MSKGAILAPQLIRIDLAVLPVASCQGLFNQIHNLFKFFAHQDKKLLRLLVMVGDHSLSIICRTSF